MTHDDLLAEAEIRNLAYAFSDAVNRADAAALTALWTADGLWLIDLPMGVSARGAPDIAKLFGDLMGAWRFFHQISNQGPIAVTGETARARMYVHEIGIFADGRTHRNWGEYVDRYRRVDGRWLYVERHYHFLYVDGPPMTPDLLGVAIEE